MVGTRIGSARRLIALTTLALPIALLLSACPPPVNTALATAVSDRLSPTITVTSPLVGQTYSASVRFTGTITDDALSAGDGKGTIRTISYTVANDVLRRGKITVNTDGTASADTSFGSGVINWHGDTRTFDFTLDTAYPSVLRGLLTITIDAADANGGHGTAVIQLGESAGPLVSIAEPGNLVTTYRLGLDTISLYGTVGNSIDDPAAAGNIKSLTWKVTVKAWRGALDIGPGSSDFNGATYSRANTGFEASMTPTNFTYDPATRQFATSFDVPFNAGSQLPIEVTATDSNGHTTTSSVVIYNDVSGPAIAISSPSVDPSARTFYSSDHFVPTVVSGTIADYTTVRDVTYRLVGAGLPGTAVSVYASGSPPGFFTPGTGNFSFALNDAVAANLAGKHGSVRVTITAANVDNNVSQPAFWLYEDSTAPSITNVTTTSNNTTNTLYAKQNDTLTLHFSASDPDSGYTENLASSNPSVTLLGTSITAPGLSATGTWTAPGSNSYSASIVVPAGPTYNGSAQFSITATDNLGNQRIPAVTSVTSGTNVIIDNSPPTVVLNYSTHPDTTVKNADTVDFSAAFTEANGLNGTPTIRIAGAGPGGTDVGPVAMSGSGLNWTYHWTVGASATMDADAAVSVSVTDVAGNPNTAATGSGTLFHVDNVAPAAPGTPTYPPGQWINKATNDAGFDISVSLASSDARNGDTLELLRNGTAWKQAALTPVEIGAGSCTFHVGAQELGADGGGADGDKAITSRLTDVAGNMGPSSAGTLTLKLDTVAPTVVLGHSGDTIVKNTDTESFTADFTDTNGLSGTPTITISGAGVSGTGGAVAMSGSAMSWSFGWLVTEAAGDHTATVSISAADPAGNYNSGVTGATSFLIDNSPPTVVLNYSTHPDTTVKNADTVDFSAAFTEANGLNGTPTIRIAGAGPGGTDVGPVAMSGSGLNWTYHWTVGASATMDADAAVSVSVTDVAGNPNTAATGSGTLFHVDNVAPAAPGTPTYPPGQWINKATNDAGFDISVSLASSDARNGDTLELLRNGTAWKQAALTPVEIGAGSCTFHVGAQELGADGGGADGDKAITSRLTDVAGNMGPSSAGTLTLKLDTVAPTVVLGHSGDTIVKNTDTESFTADFTDTNGLSGTPTITISGAGVSGTGGAVAMSGSAMSWSFGWLVTEAAGDHTATVSISAADPAGNYNSGVTGATSFLIDNSPPTVVLNYSTHPDTTVKNADTVDFSAAFTEANGLNGTPTIRIAGAGPGGTDVGPVAMSGSGLNWTYHWTVGASATMDADAAVSVSVTDVAGNPNTAATGSGTLFHVDNVTPTISLVEMIDASPPATDTNKYADVTFDSPVFKDASQGALVKECFDVTYAGGGYTATVTAIANQGGNKWRLTLSWSTEPIPSGHDVLVAAKTGLSICDRAGNFMAGGAGGTGQSKLVGMLESRPPASAAARTTSFLTSAGAWLTTTVTGRLPAGSTGAIRQEEAPVSSRQAAEVPQSATPRVQFHTPMPDLRGNGKQEGRARMPQEETAAAELVNPPGGSVSTAPAAPVTSMAAVARPAASATTGAMATLPPGQPTAPVWWHVALAVLAGAIVLAGAGLLGVRLIRRASAR